MAILKFQDVLEEDKKKELEDLRVLAVRKGYRLVNSEIISTGIRHIRKKLNRMKDCD